MLIARRLRLPDTTKALLLDLDGVLLDTLTLEYTVVGRLLRERVPAFTGQIERETVRTAFPLPIPDSWRQILAESGIEPADDLVAGLTEDLQRERARLSPAVLGGVREILDDAQAQNLKLAVVSNNPVDHIRGMLAAGGLNDRLPLVGNDQGLPGKPAPDMYLAGAREVGEEPEHCGAVEDSLLGAEAARAAGCWVVGVATGAATFAELEAAATVDAAYAGFDAPAGVRLEPGDVTDKHLNTPNEFVSHMLEHIAWRTGCSIRVDWASDDWRWLGTEVGERLGTLLDPIGDSTALGLIDDGSGEVHLTRAGDGTAGLGLESRVADLDWFLGLRVEQLATGHPLVDLLDGIAHGANVRAKVDIFGVEDAHHTWEAIFRGFGTAARGLSATLRDPQPIDEIDEVPVASGHGLRVLLTTAEAAEVERTTAESTSNATLTLGGGFTTDVQTSTSVDATGLEELTTAFAKAAGLGGGVTFSALELSSSHVVAEDVGLTIGAAVKALATERMNAIGIEGAGSSVKTGGPIRAAVSFEGRKFVKLLPVGWTDDEFRRHRLGRTLTNGAFSEDLDDFLDGFAGGMGCSVMVHWERSDDDIDSEWRAVFEALGTATAQLLAANPSRRRLIAGVKATLA